MKCFEPTLTSKDATRISRLILSGEIGFGDSVKKFENKFAPYSNKKYNIGLNSASAAAYCLFHFLYEKYGSCDVYTPSLGFASVSWAALKNGHSIHFVDVDENLLLDLDSYISIRQENLKKGKTNSQKQSVIMPVLYGGVSNIPGFKKKLEETSWKDIVVVDSAHSVKPEICCDYIFFSFHPAKPLAMSCGGLLGTNDQSASEYIMKYRNFGREQIGDTYDIVSNGFNFYMNNLNAELGLSQLDTCFESVKLRKKNLEYLESKIKPELGYITSHDINSSYYLCTLILNKPQSTYLRQKMRSLHGAASFHYPFLHQTTFFKSEVSLRKTENLQDRIINLPIHQNLTHTDMNKVADILNKEET